MRLRNDKLLYAEYTYVLRVGVVVGGAEGDVVAGLEMILLK